MDLAAIIPASVDECVSALGEHGTDAALLAGGTDLFVLMKTGARKPGIVIYLGRIAELREARQEGESAKAAGKIHLGPMITHSELIDLGLLEGLDCLTAAARSIGSPQVRNLATLGGNIANASPAGDLLPPLMALDAGLVLAGPRGEREISLEDFLEGPGVTAIEPDEVLTAIRFSRPGGRFYTGFSKVGLRNALAISVANAAMIAESADGKLKDVRLACGAVAPTPMRMKKVEKILGGEEPSEKLIDEAGRAAASECDPLTDIRATREYRRHVTGVIVSRLVRQACKVLLGYEHA